MRRKPFDLCHYSCKAALASRFPKIFIKNNLGDQIIKQLLNSVRQIIDLLATDTLTNHDILLNLVQ